MAKKKTTSKKKTAKKRKPLEAPRVALRLNDRITTAADRLMLDRGIGKRHDVLRGAMLYGLYKFSENPSLMAEVPKAAAKFE